jgi:hypothetical protein
VALLFFFPSRGREKKTFGMHFLSLNRTFEALEMAFGGQKRIFKTSEMIF